MIDIETKSGFKCEIEEDIFDDAEFVDFLSSDDARTSLGKIAIHLLGEDGKVKLYNHLRDDTGKVRFSRVEAELIEIMNEASRKSKEAKK